MAVSSLTPLGWAVERLPSPLISVLASNVLGPYGERVPPCRAAQGVGGFLVLGLFPGMLFSNPGDSWLGSEWVACFFDQFWVERSGEENESWLTSSPSPTLPVTGGSISNMYAMNLARFQRYPDCKQRGLRCLPPLALFTSEEVGGAGGPSVTSPGRL